MLVGRSLANLLHVLPESHPYSPAVCPAVHGTQMPRAAFMEEDRDAAARGGMPRACLDSDPTLTHPAFWSFAEMSPPCLNPEPQEILQVVKNVLEIKCSPVRAVLRNQGPLVSTGHPVVRACRTLRSPPSAWM